MTPEGREPHVPGGCPCPAKASSEGVQVLGDLTWGSVCTTLVSFRCFPSLRVCCLSLFSAPRVGPSALGTGVAAPEGLLAEGGSRPKSTLLLPAR